MQQWELEALEQKIPCTEFSAFLRMKESSYRQSLRREDEGSTIIFANSSRNKLTEYGNRYVVEKMLQLSPVERAVIVAKFNFDELRKKLTKGFTDDEQRESFNLLREDWFLSLKERMRDLRISKETLESFGLNWKECKTFAYQAV